MTERQKCLALLAGSWKPGSDLSDLARIFLTTTPTMTLKAALLWGLVASLLLPGTDGFSSLQPRGLQCKLRSKTPLGTSHQQIPIVADRPSGFTSAIPCPTAERFNGRTSTKSYTKKHHTILQSSKSASGDGSSQKSSSSSFSLEAAVYMTLLAFQFGFAARVGSQVHPADHLPQHGGDDARDPQGGNISIYLVWRQQGHEEGGAQRLEFEDGTHDWRPTSGVVLRAERGSSHGLSEPRATDVQCAEPNKDAFGCALLLPHHGQEAIQGANGLAGHLVGFGFDN